MDRIRVEADKGLHESSRWRLKFWRRSEINAEAARASLEAVDLLARSSGEVSVQHAAALGKIAAGCAETSRQALAALREALSIVSAGAASGVGGASGMACRLNDRVCMRGGPALFFEIVRQADAENAPEAIAVHFVERLVNAGAGAAWGLETCKAPPADNAAAFAALGLTCGKHAAALEGIATEAPRWADPKVTAHLRRREEIRALSLPDDWKKKADATLLGEVANAAVVAPATTFAIKLAKDCGGDLQVARPLLGWAIDAAANPAWSGLRAAVEPLLEDGRRAVLLEGMVSALEARRRDDASAVAEIAGKLLQDTACDAPVVKTLVAEVARRAAPEIGSLLTRISSAARNISTVQRALAWVAAPDSGASPAVARLGAAALKDGADAEETIALAGATADAIRGCGNSEIAVQTDFLTRVARMPFSSREHLAGAVRAGVERLAAGTTVGVDGLAEVAMAMSIGTGGFADRSRIARIAMADMEQRAQALGDPALAETIHTMRNLADVEDAAMQASPNRVWFRAASALAVLRALEHASTLATAGLPAMFSGLVYAQWASLDFQSRVGEVLLNEMERLATASGDAIFMPVLEETRKAVAAAPDAKSRVQALQKGLLEITRLNQNPYRKALGQALAGRGAQPSIENEDEYVVIGGVRVPKAGGQVPAREVGPVISQAEPPPHPQVPPPDLRVEDAALLQTADPALRRESKSAYQRGQGGVYNPMSGEIQWHSAYARGVGGAYNPNTGEVEWKSAYSRGVAGVYNPVTGEVQWQQHYDRGVAGVFNPLRGDVEWKISYHRGVGGVWNPLKGGVEWKDGYERGVAVAGAFDFKTGQVEWKTGYQRGIALVSTDPLQPTLSSASFSRDFDD
ncbi:MAG: hypothetical protein FJX76_15370 [Armatimonadetes bacterium]|nr:hypothetical protein [Armatimonadota bacterium]